MNRPGAEPQDGSGSHGEWEDIKAAKPSPQLQKAAGALGEQARVAGAKAEDLRTQQKNYAASAQKSIQSAQQAEAAAASAQADGQKYRAWEEGYKESAAEAGRHAEYELKRADSVERQLNEQMGRLDAEGVQAFRNEIEAARARAADYKDTQASKLKEAAAAATRAEGAEKTASEQLQAKARGEEQAKAQSDVAGARGQEADAVEAEVESLEDQARALTAPTGGGAEGLSDHAEALRGAESTFQKQVEQHRLEQHRLEGEAATATQQARELQAERGRRPE